LNRKREKRRELTEVLIAPALGALGAIVALLTKCILVVERKE